MRRIAPPDRERGFTLIEALVALAVLAVCLPAIGQLGFSTVTAARHAEMRLLLASAARKAYAALPDRASLGAGSFAGNLDGAPWRLRAAPYLFNTAGAPGNPPWTPVGVRLTVAAPGGGELVVDTIRLAPTGAAQ